MSNIVILVGSMRRGGNTDLLARAFAEGARKKHTVELISVADYRVEPCVGCNFCQSVSDGHCCRNDAMAEVYEKLKTADTIVIATPVYFYGLSAPLKALVDRLHAPIRKGFRVKQLALLAVSADTLPEVFDAILMQYRLTAQYFGLSDAGSVLVRGVEEKGAIQSRPEALQQAYALGEAMD